MITLRSRIFLLLTALVFLGFGVAFLVAPVYMTSLVDIRLEDPTAVAEIRAFYGGMELGIGAYILFSAFRPALVRPTLMLVMLSLGGSAIARLSGVLTSPDPEPLLVEIFLIEALAAIFAGALWKLDARIAPKA